MRGKRVTTFSTNAEPKNATNSNECAPWSNQHLSRPQLRRRQPRRKRQHQPGEGCLAPSLHRHQEEEDCLGAVLLEKLPLPLRHCLVQLPLPQLPVCLVLRLPLPVVSLEALPTRLPHPVGCLEAQPRRRQHPCLARHHRLPPLVPPQLLRHPQPLPLAAHRHPQLPLAALHPRRVCLGLHRRQPLEAPHQKPRANLEADGESRVKQASNKDKKWLQD